MPKVDHSQERALVAALDGVSTTGQALAVADACLAALEKVRERFGGWGWSVANAFTLGLYGLTAVDRTHAIDELDQAKADVVRYRDPLGGPSQAITASSEWSSLRSAVERAYSAMWAISAVEGEGDEWSNFAQWSADVAAESVQALPVVINSVVEYTGDLATKTVGAAAGGLVSGLWPVLLVAGGLLVVAVVVKARVA